VRTKLESLGETVPAAPNIKTRPGHKARKGLTHRQAKRVAADHWRDAGLVPDVRTQFEILQAKRAEAAADGRVFENRIDDNGDWV